MIPKDRKVRMAALRAKRQESARRCYHEHKRAGYTCSGCDWGQQCRMSADQARWLGAFLEAIDLGQNIAVVGL